MCLITDQKKFRIAPGDIPVYKVLHDKRTPYRNKRVFFFFGKAILRSKLILQENNIVNIGIHSYIDVYDAKRSFNAFTERVHYAIIPKGSKYFISSDKREIASNKLIIFKSPSQWYKYLRKK